MPPPPVTVQRSGPGAKRILSDIERIRKSDVLVGIPATQTLRKGEPINNASLMFIHTHGSQVRNIPARATIEPAVQENRGPIAVELKAAAKALVQHKPEEAERALGRAGVIASNAAKRKFGSADLAPNAPSTIRNKGSDKPLIDTGALRRAVTWVTRLAGRQPNPGRPDEDTQPQTSGRHRK